MAVKGAFGRPVAHYADDPLLGPTSWRTATEVSMGAIVANGDTPMYLTADVIGSSPIDRIDIFYGKTLARTIRPFSPDDLGKRIRVMWSGAEYRGRGGEGNWHGKAAVDGNAIK